MKLLSRSRIKEAIQIAHVGLDDVVVSGAAGELANLSVVASIVSPSEVIASYRVTPPGAVWGEIDSGSYSVIVQPFQVLDISDKSAAQDVIGMFQVQIGIVGNLRFTDGSEQTQV